MGASVGASLVVGFDLDMTLVDPRPGVVASWRALAKRTGVAIDARLVASRLGPPLEAEIANWFPAERVPEATELYRRLHAAHGVPATLPMQGARDACDAVLDAGGRVVVVTAKKPELARMVIDRLGLPVGALHAGLWGGGKAPALRREGAGVYVGDHPADVEAARAAGALSVGAHRARGAGRGGCGPSDVDLVPPLARLLARTGLTGTGADSRSPTGTARLSPPAAASGGRFRRGLACACRGRSGGEVGEVPSEVPGDVASRRASRRSAPGLRLLQGLPAVAVLVSIVHYADNVANYAAYPQPVSGPAPSRGLIAASWFAFTGFGAAGLALFARRRYGSAAACLAVYSLSGLVGVGHYTVPGATGMPWWRQLHVVADVACGLAVLAFAAWALWALGRPGETWPSVGPSVGPTVGPTVGGRAGG